MDKGVFTIFGEEFLTVLPIAVIATALNILLCLTLPPFFAVPICAFGSVLGIIVSSCTIGSNMEFMLRGIPYRCQCQPEGKFAHFCHQFDYLVCNGILMALGFTGYGAAIKRLGIEINLAPTDEMKQIILKSHKAMLETLSLETPRDEIAYFAAGIFCFNFLSFCCPRFYIQLLPVSMILICCCIPDLGPG
jgi:hypothetical protein